jgi:hypothetical protein
MPLIETVVAAATAKAAATAIASKSAVVHIVGIVLLTYSVSPDKRLQAIAPRLDGGSAHYERRKDAAHHNGPDIEKHIALIAFRTEDHVQGGNWTPQPLTSISGYSYVALNGDQVELIDGLLGPRTVPQTAPPIDGLPRLSTCCGAGDLRPEFKPPFTGAVAVLDFPLRTTSPPTTCAARINGQDPNGEARIDTRVSVDNAGVLKVRAGSRELLLDGNAELYFAHLPPGAISNPGQHHATGRPHYEAYARMVNLAACPDFLTCHGEKPRPCDAVMRPAGTGTGKGDTRTTEKLVQRQGDDGKPVRAAGKGFTAALSIDYQCSNSQWP